MSHIKTFEAKLTVRIVVYTGLNIAAVVERLSDVPSSNKGSHQVSQAALRRILIP